MITSRNQQEYSSIPEGSAVILAYTKKHTVYVYKGILHRNRVATLRDCDRIDLRRIPKTAVMLKISESEDQVRFDRIKYLITKKEDTIYAKLLR